MHLWLSSMHTALGRLTRCWVQAALCSLYNIGHYPTLRFGRPADFEVGRGKLEEYSGVREEKEIVEWVGKLQST